MAHIGIPAIYRGQQLMRTMPDDVKEFYNGTDFKVAVDLAGIVWVKWFGDCWVGIYEESEKDALIEYFRYIMKAMKEDYNGCKHNYPDHRQLGIPNRRLSADLLGAASAAGRAQRGNGENHGGAEQQHSGHLGAEREVER